MIMIKTIDGIVTWLKQWFYGKDEIYDTGWQDFSYREVTYPVRIALVEGGSMIEVADSSAWMSLTGSTSSTFMQDYNNEPVKIRRIGNVVHIEGAFTTDIAYNNEFPLKGLCCGEHNNTTYNGDYLFTVGNLSEEFRPSDPILTIQQGSGINKFFLRIDTDGNVKITRYGSNSYVNPQTNPWLNFNVTYTIG